MLLTHRVVSIPPSLSSIKDLTNSSSSSSLNVQSLQYFNMRVTARLHRYRHLKRQWNELTMAAIQTDLSSTSLHSKSDSHLILPEILPITHEQLITDYFNSTTIKNSNTFEADPTQKTIQKDLIQLRKLIKARHKKLRENHASKKNNSLDHNSIDELEKPSIRKLLSSTKPNALNRVRISGSQMRPSTFPPADSPTRKTSAHSTQQAKLRQQNLQKVFNIYRVRVNHTLPSDALIQGVPPPQQRIQTVLKPNTKQTTTSRQPAPPTTTTNVSPPKKQVTFIKPERTSPLSQERTTTCPYTFAASTSSAAPRSMQLNRKTSLLPILLTSSPCVGIQRKVSHLGKTPDNPESSYTVVDYRNLIRHLPQPIVTLPAKSNQDDYQILFEQLDYLREHMPGAEVYENFTRGY